MSKKNIQKPYTPDEVKAEFKAYGMSITQFCREHKLNRMSVVDLLRGNALGLRGDSHRAAVLLGMKLDPVTKRIRHPFENLAIAA
jgi:gp16 family phage-associated protein